MNRTTSTGSWNLLNSRLAPQLVCCFVFLFLLLPHQGNRLGKSRRKQIFVFFRDVMGMMLKDILPQIWLFPLCTLPLCKAIMNPVLFILTALPACVFPCLQRILRGAFGTCPDFFALCWGYQNKDSLPKCHLSFRGGRRGDTDRHFFYLYLESLLVNCLSLAREKGNPFL